MRLVINYMIILILYTFFIQPATRYLNMKRVKIFKEKFPFVSVSKLLLLDRSVVLGFFPSKFYWIIDVLHVETVFYQQSTDETFQDTCLDSVAQWSIIATREAKAYYVRTNYFIQGPTQWKSFHFCDGTFQSTKFLSVRIPTPKQHIFTIQNWSCTGQICPYAYWTRYFE